MYKLCSVLPDKLGVLCQQISKHVPGQDLREKGWSAGNVLKKYRNRIILCLNAPGNQLEVDPWGQAAGWARAAAE